MVTEEELRLEARLVAIEQLLVKVTNGMLLHFGPAEFEQLLNAYAAGLETASVPGVDPALADVFAAQFRDETLRLIRGIREERKKVPRYQ
jgi:hypothetical protein